MSDQLFTSFFSIFTAIVGLAIVAVIVGQNSQTSSVLSAFTGGFAQDISAAVSPVTGNGSSFTNYSPKITIGQ